MAIAMLPSKRRAFAFAPMFKKPLEPRVRFAALFGLLSAILFGLYFFPYAENGGSEAWLTVYLERYTALVGTVLGIVEPRVVVSHTQILGRFSMIIVRSCDGMEANILFCAALLAMPGAWWRKALALCAGLVALIAFNVIRLCCLYFVGVYFPAQFDFAHYDLWPLLIIAFAVLDFFACVRWLQEDSTHATPPAEPTHVAA
jgi:exosortase/archaeosortase family protein